MEPIDKLVASQIATLPSFPPPNLADAKSGDYVFKYASEFSVFSDDAETQSKVWFGLPHLNEKMMERIISIQLFAESHDQGFVASPEHGNWTWFEFSILDNATAKVPCIRDTVELTWKTHPNRLGTSDFGWSQGPLFHKDHQLFSQMDDDDVIGVRLCSRFPGWEIVARTAFVLIKLGDETLPLPREDFKPILEGIYAIQEAFAEVNAQTNVAFVPQSPQSLSKAGEIGDPKKQPLRVLSLDGGGIRGLSSLYLLRAVLRKLFPGKSDDELRPCEIFDMIAGTSTGGLIAIMLGRLGMSIQEAISEYESLAKKIFSTWWKKGRYVTKGAYYDAAPLEDAIKQCITRKLGNEDVLLWNQNVKCRVFVLAVREKAANNREPVFLRSYTNPQNLSLIPECRIWEAGRATSAAPVYFKSITVGKYELLDGGLGANNPLGWLWNEVLDVFGPARHTDCFLSIGTGIPENKPLGVPGVISQKDFATNISEIATNAQLIHILFKTLINAYAPNPGLKKYWRLNIGEEIEGYEEVVEEGRLWYKKKKVVTHLDNYKDLGDMDDVGKMDMIRDMTEKYMALQDALISECANAIQNSFNNS